MQKIILVTGGIFFCIVILELGLRLGGSIILSLQESRNSLSIKQKGTCRIICLGESTTALGGYGSYPYQLEEILNRHSKGVTFSVINKGITGTNTFFILSRLETNLNEYNPDIAVVMMGINDGKSFNYYENYDLRISRPLGSMRVFKLMRFLNLHIKTKIREFSIGSLVRKKAKPVLRYGLDPEALKELDFWEVALPCFAEGAKNKLFSGLDIYDTFIVLGRYYGEEKAIYKSEELFNKAIALSPDKIEAYAELGMLCSSQYNEGQAKALFKKAIELDSKRALDYIDYRRFNKIQWNMLRVEEAFKRAIELSPKNDELYIDFAWFYIKQNKLSQAQELLEKAVTANPESDGIFAALSNIYRQAGQYVLMQEYYGRATKLRSDYYNPMTSVSYYGVKKILDARGVKLICVQYPLRSIKPLQKIFQGESGVTFVDNEQSFKYAVGKTGYNDYFVDMFAGDFGHCTPKGNRLLAENIAKVILKEVSSR